jgi:WD40 repeat protein
MFERSKLTQRIFMGILLWFSLMTVFSWGQESPVRTLKGQLDAVTALAYSPDGKYLATGSFDNSIYLWNPQTGDLVKKLSGLNKRVSSVVFSPDSKTLAGSSWMLHDTSGQPASGKGPRRYEGEVKIWNVESGQVQKTLTWQSAPMWDLDFQPQGQLLAGGTGMVRDADGKYYGRVIMWNLQTGVIQKRLKAVGAPVWCVAFSPDGKYLAAGSGLDLEDRTYEVLVWNLEADKIEHHLIGHSGRVISLSFSPDGGKLASASADHTLRIWDMKTGALIKTLDREGEVPPPQPGQASPSTHTDQVKTDSPGFYSVIQKGWTNFVTFSKDGSFLAGLGGTRRICLWEVQTGKLLHALTSPSRAVYSVALSPDGQQLASGNADGTINLWNIKGVK